MASAFDHEDYVTEIAKAMYVSGSNNRSVKAGNWSAMVATVMQSSGFHCIGLYKYLPSNFKALIDDKNNFKSMKEEDIQHVFRFILANANTHKTDTYYLWISRRVYDALEDYVSGREVSKNMLYILNLRKWFIDQERKKSTGGAQKANSEFKYIEINHAKEIESLKKLSLDGKKIG